MMLGKMYREMLTCICESIDVENYYDNTMGKWSGLSADEIKAFMSAYLAWRRKRVKMNGIMVNGKEYVIDYQSEKKNSFFRSRGFSYYFIEKGTDNIIRISDHWSSTGTKYPRSKKLNCGRIASCYWTLNGGDVVSLKLPGEKYDSMLAGGKIAARDFVKFSDGRD